MTADEFRNALRCLLNDAARSGLHVDDILSAAEEELHPPLALDDSIMPPRRSKTVK